MSTPSTNGSSASTLNTAEPQHAATSDGRWGEDIEGGGVDVAQAEQEFEDLRRELSRTSRISRVASAVHSEAGEYDIEKHAADDEDGEGWDLEAWLRNETKKEHESGLSPKRIGVSFRNLTVKGVGSGANYVQTFTDAFLGFFGLDIWNFIRAHGPSSLRPKPPVRTIIQDFNGLVRAGQMLLVLGSPGSGTTTLLRALTNQRDGYVAVDGEVIYDGIDAATAAKRYRGEIIFNSEDDNHISTLTVSQTLRFALSLKTPAMRINGETREQFVDKLLNLYVKMFGIEHTLNTLVGGDAAARGVSGGERKRVSIAEVLANRAAIVAFDNSTRGLDSSTAVDYIRSLRIMTDLMHSTTIVTLYQAGESLYREFDKVCLIDSGRQIFFGPADEARQYFIDLGFESLPMVTTADYLTSITHPMERRIRPGFEDSAPQSPEALEAAFKASRYYTDTMKGIEEYHTELQNTGHASASEFSNAVKMQKAKGLSSTSPYTVSFFQQVRYLIKRQFQLQWQDQVSLRSKLINSIVIGLVFGSLFYNIKQDTSGAFNRGGILFFALVFNGWVLMIESGMVIAGRSLANKHQAFGMYRQSALALAKTIAELPLLFVQITVYILFLYFLSDLARTPGQFFISLLMILTSTFGLLSFYRAIAVFSNDFNACLRLVSMILYALAFAGGYVKSQYSMPWWYRWVYYIDPLSYAFSALMSNEFHHREMLCMPSQLVPALGPDGLPADISNQACTLPGSEPGEPYVNGDRYVSIQFGYERQDLWRNFGILIAYFAFFLIVQVVGSELITYSTAGGGQVKRFVKQRKSVQVQSHPKAETPVPSTATTTTTTTPSSPTTAEKDIDGEKPSHLRREGPLFTFRNVNYIISTPNGPRQLLDNVEGYAAPGKLLALMGASGAGKTTLLNTLSQRMTFGNATGEYLLNGSVLSKDFQRTTGFVEQQDLHEANQTIREALRFSARLRQPADVPLEEKYAYVEDIIKLLDLGPIADALIDYPGSGLSVEERKRVTIGIELASKPRLLFLDEPTSGLDSEGAFSIVTFLRRLAQAENLSIICTIHQPSSVLFNQFDNILLLNRGGKTAYFGPIGDSGRSVINYFSKRAAPPAPDENPAEYILEVVGAGIRRSKTDWFQVWQDSEERQNLGKEITRLIEARRSTVGTEQRPAEDLEYAAPLMEQIRAVTIRLWLIFWRTPSFGYSVIFNSVICGIISGVVFFQLKNSILDMQSRAFLMFFAIIVSIPTINAIEIQFIMARDLYELRERNSKVYSWIALVSAYLLCVTPYAVLGAVTFFPIFWYMPGMYMKAPIAGFGFWVVLLLQIWHNHLAIWLGAFVPSLVTAGIINPFFFVLTEITVGIMIPYTALNGFYKFFIYWVNPLSWIIRALVTTAVHDVPVICDEAELATFTPPSNMTCDEFAGYWVENHSVGMLLNPDATSNCQFCQYTVGDDYLNQIGFSYGTRWRDIGVFLGFVVFNVVFAYFLYYVMRVVKWSWLGKMKKMVGRA
ncbi:ABC-2 type transporter-domain-containing protein [Lipomyces tetrasporus]|uniref:ABC-2 type transporter-domain-containing protein n=1 Tax=Lipomyces tetrasporus TaxID=54092 RepID=A0AAD7VQS0_9ASCO|nr:ABC-2 type transporter-domain-containing protein [Lipomyces tetrasporus]KAJ8097450.1 ABC-2 type transporter-domain-containing protein [Lipomyces tetrasporus]